MALAETMGWSRSRAASAIRDGLVDVDGAACTRASRSVDETNVVVVREAEVVVSPAPDMPPVRYRDEHVAIIAKPAGMVVHTGPGHVGDTLVDALLAGGMPLVGGAEERPGIVHRLDRDTSGLLAISLSELAYQSLTDQLRERTVVRRYLALVDGVLPAARGKVDAPLARHANDRMRFAVRQHGRRAVTDWQVIDGTVNPTLTLVGCRLETGRTHQIRVHLQHAGASVLGDRVYGGDTRRAQDLRLDRPFLHAARLSFIHPVTGETVSVAEPLPDDLCRVLTEAGLDVGVADRWAEDG